MDFKAEALASFDAETMAELASIVRMSDQSAIALFRADLVDTCAHYRAVIATMPCDLPNAPFNLSLTKRAEWLETNVVKPSERLLGAIENEMKPMFSTWPYPLTVPVFRDNINLKNELADLLASSTHLRDWLRSQQADDAGHSQELRQEIFNDVARLMRKHCPTVNPSRGVNDPELRRRVGVYVEAMQLIFGKITGVVENLDRLIRGEIKYPS